MRHIGLNRCRRCWDTEPFTRSLRRFAKSVWSWCITEAHDFSNSICVRLSRSKYWKTLLYLKQDCSRHAYEWKGIRRNNQIIRSCILVSKSPRPSLKNERVMKFMRTYSNTLEKNSEHREQHSHQLLWDLTWRVLLGWRTIVMANQQCTQEQSHPSHQWLFLK